MTLSTFGLLEKKNPLSVKLTKRSSSYISCSCVSTSGTVSSAMRIPSSRSAYQRVEIMCENILDKKQTSSDSQVQREKSVRMAFFIGSGIRG